MTPCKEWVGARDKDGYGLGRADPDRKMRRMHRVEWERHNGSIPNGMMVCHHCDNPPCLEITHLFLGTAADNTEDMMAKGRYVGNGLKGNTHCPQNHELIGANLYVAPDGKRICKICRRESDSRRYYRDPSRKAERRVTPRPPR